MPNMLRKDTWEIEHDTKTGRTRKFHIPEENETEFPAKTYRREVPVSLRDQGVVGLARLGKPKKKRNALIPSIEEEEID